MWNPLIGCNFYFIFLHNLIEIYFISQFMMKLHMMSSRDLYLSKTYIFSKVSGNIVLIVPDLSYPVLSISHE